MWNKNGQEEVDINANKTEQQNDVYHKWPD